MGEEIIITFDIIKPKRRNCVSVEIGMNNKASEKAKNTIKLCKVKLENLKNRLEESDEANVVYNRILIEKAVLEEEIKTKPLFARIKELFTNNKEKRICDYFKNDKKAF